MGAASDELLSDDDDDRKRGASKELLAQSAGERYGVFDSQTGAKVGDYESRKRASRVADKRDIEYGAVRYVVRRIPLGPAPKS